MIAVSGWEQPWGWLLFGLLGHLAMGALSRSPARG